MSTPQTSLLILSNVNLEPLEAKFQKNNATWKVKFDGFNTLEQTLFSGLKNQSTGSWIWIHADFNYPGLITETAPNVNREKCLESFQEKWTQWLKQIRQHPEFRFIVSLPYFKMSWNEGRSSCIQKESLQWQCSDWLISAIKNTSNISIFAFQNIITKSGEQRSFDSRLWIMGRIPYSYDLIEDLSTEIKNLIDNSTQAIKKLLLLDLDNTLWGGILDEENWEGLQIGTEGTGLAYQNFQKAILSLQQRGILLAILSKNNKKDVIELLQKHPNMILRDKHFVSIKANWNAKAENIQELSNELDLGINSFVLIDDSPQEREEIKQCLPDVATPELPKDPAQLTDWLYDSLIPRYFNPTKSTTEDFSKTEQYHAKQNRKELQEQNSNYDTFLQSLKIKLNIKKATQKHLPRIEQLLNKTNQFNTNKQPQHRISTLKNFNIWILNYEDKFGKEGLVGVIISHQSSETLEINQFSLSCRVLRRNVEFAFLLKVVEMTPASSNITFHFKETDRNQQAKSFLQTLSTNDSLESGIEIPKLINILKHKIQHIDYVTE